MKKSKENRVPETSKNSTKNIKNKIIYSNKLLFIIIVLIILMVTSIFSLENKTIVINQNKNIITTLSSATPLTTSISKEKIWEGTETPEQYRATFALYATVSDVIRINYIEDLVDLSEKVAEGESFEGKNIYLLRTLDFQEKSHYKKWDGDYGDLNGDENTQTIYEELTNTETGKGFTPIGNNDNPFSGNFYGQGFEIQNVYINNSSLDYVGLFGNTNEALIRDLGITGSIISSRGVAIVGSIAGRVHYTSIINCNNKADIKGYCVGGIVGTLAGYNTISQCYNTSNLKAKSRSIF